MARATAGIRSHILVGYIPTPEGVAALDYAIVYAEQNSARLTVVNTGRDGDYADPQFATAEDIDAIDELLSTKGGGAHHRAPRRRQVGRRSPAGGSRQARRGRDRHRRPPPFPRRQAAHRQHRPSRHPRRRMPGHRGQADRMTGPHIATSNPKCGDQVSVTDHDG